MDTSTPTGPGPAPEPAAPPQNPTHPSNSFFEGIRRLGITRSDDRWIGGVSGGLADRFGIDPLLVRGIFVATLLLGGLGLVAYGAAWALLPERRDGRIHLEEMILGRFDIALLGALAFVIVGFGRGDSWFFFWGPPGWLQGLLWFAFVAGIVVLIIVVANQQPSRPRPPVPYATSTPPAAGAPTMYPAATPHATYPAATSTAAYPATTAPAPAAPVPPYGAPPAQAWASSATPPPPAPPARTPNHPRPPRPRTPGAGAGTVGVVVALSLLSLAVLLIAERSGDFTGPVGLTALGIGIVLCGLGIIVSGLRGRTSGGLGGLAVIGILVAVPVGAVQNNHWIWTADGQHDLAASGDVLVTSRADAAEGYSMGFGDVTIDLSDVPMTSTTLEVPISLAAGDLTVVVPSDASISADVDAGAGTVRWEVDGESKSVDGVGLNPRTFTTGAFDDGGPQLALQVQIGAGDVTITEEN
ncbi:MAG: PspC domain-containing protein [Cellulomonas sp.]